MVFGEKGAGVKIGVALVVFACDRKMDSAVLCGSDSDLQPAVAELKLTYSFVYHLNIRSYYFN